MSDLADALQSMQGGDSGYVKAKAYAHGPISEVFASPRLKRILRNKQVSFQDVLGNVVIGAVADKLEITSIDVLTDSDTTDEKAKEVLDEQDEHNKMALVRPHVMRKALEYGDAYLMAWPSADANGDEAGGVEISYHDPRSMRLLYDTDNPMKKRLAIHKWATDDKKVRVNLYYPPETVDGKAKIVRWVSRQPNGRASTPEDFEPFNGDGEEHEEEHDYGLPIFHFTTTMPGEYGVPEHKPFYPTQDKLNKLTVSHMAGVDYYAIPQRYALLEAGADTSEAADMDEDEFLVSPDGEKTVHPEGAQKSSLSSEPGTVWWQRGVKAFGQFDNADPQAFLEPSKFYLSRGAFVTSTPLYLFLDSGDFPSGKALRTANAPLDKKTNARKLSFDSTWREFYTFVLKLLNVENGSVSISWAPIQTIDEDEKVALAQQKQAAGVPAEVTLTGDLGYKQDVVDQWMEDGEALIPQKVELVGNLANAISSLVPAESAGVLEPGSVNALFKLLVDEIRSETGDDTEFKPDPVESVEPDVPEQPDPGVIPVDSATLNGGRPRRGDVAPGNRRSTRGS